MCQFNRYIGIDYSGAETADSSCKGIRVFMAEGSGTPVQVRREGLPVLARVSNIGQSAAWRRGILIAMTKVIRILKVEKDGEDGVIATFSDGTKAEYAVEELLLLSLPYQSFNAIRRSQESAIRNRPSVPPAALRC